MMIVILKDGEKCLKKFINIELFYYLSYFTQHLWLSHFSGTPQLIAPSNVGPYYAKAAPRAVTKEEIEVLIKQFGDAAYRMKIAGGDGVEIHAAHAHTLIFAVGYKVDRTLIDTLDRLGIKYHLVGDSNKVASIKEAITDALNLTKDL